MQNSSDIGMIKPLCGLATIDLRIIAPGFGRQSDVDLPGEGADSRNPPPAGQRVQSVRSRWVRNRRDAAAVMPGWFRLLPMAAFYQPYVVKKSSIRKTESSLRRSLTANSNFSRDCAKLQDMLEGVVTDGTAKSGSRDTCCGQTGTAQKIEETTGRYSRQHVASFASLLRNPVISMIVMVDEAMAPRRGCCSAGLP